MRVSCGEEALLVYLKLHLRRLEHEGYCGVRILRFTREDNLATFLLNFVKIYLHSCDGCRSYDEYHG